MGFITVGIVHLGGYSAVYRNYYRLFHLKVTLYQLTYMLLEGWYFFKGGKEFCEFMNVLAMTIHDNDTAQNKDSASYYV